MADQASALKQTPATLTFASQLLRDGKITRASFNMLRRTLALDLAAEAQRAATRDINRSRRVIPGNVTVEHESVEQIWKVFNTAELLEKILSYVPLADLVLSVPLVCKGFHDAVKDSPTLLKLSYRKARWDAPKSYFDLEMFRANKIVPGIYSMPHCIDVWPANIDEAARASDGLRATFTSQPPVKQVRLGRYLNCNEKHTPMRFGFVSDLLLQNSNGITYGQVMDLFPRDIRQDEAWCESCCIILVTKEEVDVDKQSSSEADWADAGEIMGRARAHNRAKPELSEPDF